MPSRSFATPLLAPPVPPAQPAPYAERQRQKAATHHHRTFMHEYCYFLWVVYKYINSQSIAMFDEHSLIRALVRKMAAT